MSLRLAAKYSLTTNTHKKQNVLKVDRLNYTYESNEGSPVSFLAHDESQNLHVKMDKNHRFLALIALSKEVNRPLHFKWHACHEGSDSRASDFTTR